MNSLSRRNLVLILSALALPEISACGGDSVTPPTLPPAPAWTRRVADADLAPDLYTVYRGDAYRAGGDLGTDMQSYNGSHWWLHRNEGSGRVLGYADLFWGPVSVRSGGVLTCKDCPGDTYKDYDWEFTAIAGFNHGVVAVGETGHVVTYDGTTQTEYQTDVPADFTDVTAHNDGYYLAACSDGTIRKSSFGVTWNLVGNTGAGRLRSLAAHGTAIVAVGGEGQLVRSDDSGATWKTDNQFTGLRDVGWSGSHFVAVGDGGFILVADRSAFGQSGWRRVPSGTTLKLRSVSNNSPIFAVGDAATILTSNDDLTWRRREPAHPEKFTEVMWTGSQFVAAAGLPAASPVYNSRDGITWERAGTVEQGSSIWGFIGLGSSGTRAIASANVLGLNGGPSHARVYASDDLQNWRIVHEAPNSEYAQEVFLLNGKYYVVCSNELLRSPDGETWTSLPRFTYARLIGFASVTVCDNVLYGIQWEGGLESSTDLVGWQSAGNLSLPGLKADINWTGTGFLVSGYTNGGFEGRVWWSRDGYNWKDIQPDTEDLLSGSAASGQRWVVVGDNGAIFTREN